MYIKKVIVSKTVLFNLLMLVIGILPLLAMYLKVWMPEQVVMIDSTIALVAGIVNLVLRIFFTAQPVTAFAARRASSALGLKADK